VVKSAEGLFTPNKAVPYGVAIAAGAMFTVPRMDVLPESWGTMVRFILG
jgi:Flp pilus assembly protein protease CpaA